MVDKVSEELWTQVWNIVQQVVTKSIDKKKKCKKAKWLRKHYKHLRKGEKQKAKEKGKDIP